MSALRRAKVELPDVEGSFDCYLGDDRWNGFRCPFFTRAQADVLLEALVKDGTVDRYAWWGDPAEQASYALTLFGDGISESEDIGEAFDSCSRETVDGNLMLWSIGGWCWCWVEEAPPAPKEI
jgi:hypothetical protein